MKCSIPKAQETALNFRLVVVFPDGGLEEAVNFAIVALFGYILGPFVHRGNQFVCCLKIEFL
jgi:hypothetical protein